MLKQIFLYLFLSCFFADTFQNYIEGNNTLIIYNENEFTEEFSNSTESVIILGNVSSITSGEFSEWTQLNYAYIGSSVTSIGGSAFSSCSNLESVIIGENVKEIGDSAFSNCTKLPNITIPHSVTSIGGSVFSSCSNLESVVIGENVKDIGDSAFSNCTKLKCIYYYGTKEPNIGSSAFTNVSAVMVLEKYVEETFGELDITKGTVEGCAPMPTLAFTQSNTFSNSNTFTASLRSDLSQTFSFILTVSLSISYSMTCSAIDTQTISYYLSNSELSYVETNFIYYNYTVIIYSTYYSYYSNFFAYVYLSPNDNTSNGMTTAALIGIICGAVAFVLIVIAAVTFLVKSNHKRKSRA